MHEEATSMSVPSSVAASTSHGQNGTAAVDVELDPLTADNSVSDNVELQVSYSSNSAGTYSPQHMFFSQLFSG